MFDADLIPARPNIRAVRLRKQIGRVESPTDLMLLEPSNKHQPGFVPAYEAANKNDLDIIVTWSKPIADLCQVLDRISDWGPFELTHAASFASEDSDSVKVYCRFRYHGAKASRAYFEGNLKSLIEEHAVWEDARAPERTSTPA